MTRDELLTVVEQMNQATTLEPYVGDYVRQVAEMAFDHGYRKGHDAGHDAGYRKGCDTGMIMMRTVEQRERETVST